MNVLFRDLAVFYAKFILHSYWPQYITASDCHLTCQYTFGLLKHFIRKAVLQLEILRECKTRS